MYRVFIVEDDEAIAASIKKQLELWGYKAQCAQDFRSVLHEFTEFDPHLVIIDIMLPFFNGYYWCTEIRKISAGVPIIFLSSASDNMNIVMAINLGADDFIAKPFDTGVLTAKVRAVMRRTYDLAGKAAIIEHNGALLNLNDMSVTYQSRRAELTRNEFRIIQTLFENKGKIVSRETLMVRLWEIDSYIEENTLTVNMTRLRRKLESIGLYNFIITKVGKGYIIE